MGITIIFYYLNKIITEKWNIYAKYISNHQKPKNYSDSDSVVVSDFQVSEKFMVNDRYLQSVT